MDQGRVDLDLTKEGIDHTSFWNIARLTPSVYRHEKADAWAVKYDPALIDPDGLKERASYVLENIVAILLTRQTNKGIVPMPVEIVEAGAEG